MHESKICARAPTLGAISITNYNTYHSLHKCKDHNKTKEQACIQLVSAVVMEVNIKNAK